MSSLTDLLRSLNRKNGLSNELGFENSKNLVQKMYQKKEARLMKHGGREEKREIEINSKYFSED